MNDQKPINLEDFKFQQLLLKETLNEDDKKEFRRILRKAKPLGFKKQCEIIKKLGKNA